MPELWAYLWALQNGWPRTLVPVLGSSEIKFHDDGTATLHYKLVYVPEEPIVQSTPPPPFECLFCGLPSYVDPSDQSPPPDYCHEADHGSPEDLG